jgi:DNA ligase 1
MAQLSSPWSRRTWLLALAGMLTMPFALAAGAKAPALSLANVYQPGIDLGAYWVSEKLDGVRGYWDGKQLLTRGGTVIQTPTWFTQGWPGEPMDGELWAGRGTFEITVSIVRQQVPDDNDWRKIRFMVFDLPVHPGTFDERWVSYQRLVRSMAKPWVRAVPQARVQSHGALLAQLDLVVKGGGEGLMLHRGDALYRATRSNDLLKVKRHNDAEAQVIGHRPGRGKYAGRLGALWVQSPDGRRFRLGSGFTDAQRLAPPAIGSWVTYRYRGWHDSGLPRFATFLRVRTDIELNEAPSPPAPAR